MDILRRSEGYLGLGYTDSQQHFLALQVVLILLATFSVILRLFSRRITKAALWLDDYFIIAGLLFCWGIFVTTILYLRDGFDIPFAFAHITEYIKVQLVSVILYICAAYITKASVLLLYFRIFGSGVNSFKTVIYIVGSITAGAFISSFFATLFECTPISHFWNFMGPGTCVNRLALFIATAVINTVLDFTILILPIPSILKLQLSFTRKIQLLFTFLLGTFVGVVSIIRLVYVATQNQKDPNLTQQSVNDITWTTVEVYVAVICACLPTLRPIILKGTSAYNSLASKASRSSNSRIPAGPSSSSSKTSSNRRKYWFGSGGGASKNSSTTNASDFERLHDSPSSSAHNNQHEMMSKPVNGQWRQISSPRGVPRDLEHGRGLGLPAQGIRVDSEMRSSWTTR
ncbi:hypothetical protein MMC14_003585 [Varicellaria rhodocarpa]|nr:hypothetical protein [Varicellaria rhodocarpa]